MFVDICKVNNDIRMVEKRTDKSTRDNADFQCCISISTFRQIYFRLLTARGAIGSIHNDTSPALSPYCSLSHTTRFQLFNSHVRSRRHLATACAIVTVSIM